MNFIKNNKIRFASTIIIAYVFIINIQAGIDFFLHPDKYVAAFELSGIPGLTAVAGTGLLFLMWNIPYAFALWNPIKNRISLIQALLMQLLGCIGDTFILFRFSNELYPFLSSSIQRFILFDSIGLVLLLIAAIMVWRKGVIQQSI